MAEYINVYHEYEYRQALNEKDRRAVDPKAFDDLRANPVLTVKQMRGYGLDPITLRRAAIIQAGAESRKEAITAATAIRYLAERTNSVLHPSGEVAPYPQREDQVTLGRLVGVFTCAALIADKRAAVTNSVAALSIRAALDQVAPRATYHNACPRDYKEQRYPAFIPRDP